MNKDIENIFIVKCCDKCPFDSIDGSENPRCIFYKKDHYYSRQVKTQNKYLDKIKFHKKPDFCKVKLIKIFEREVL
jgi:hypothetical protein